MHGSVVGMARHCLRPQGEVAGNNAGKAWIGACAGKRQDRRVMDRRQRPEQAALVHAAPGQQDARKRQVKFPRGGFGEAIP